MCVSYVGDISYAESLVQNKSYMLIIFVNFKVHSKYIVFNTLFRNRIKSVKLYYANKIFFYGRWKLDDGY